VELELGCEDIVVLDRGFAGDDKSEPLAGGGLLFAGDWAVEDEALVENVVEREPEPPCLDKLELTLMESSVKPI